jgi:hypothetical protein
VLEKTIQDFDDYLSAASMSDLRTPAPKRRYHWEEVEADSSMGGQFRSALAGAEFRISVTAFQRACELLGNHRQQLGEFDYVKIACDLMYSYCKSGLKAPEQLSPLFGEVSRTFSDEYARHEAQGIGLDKFNRTLPNAIHALQYVASNVFDQIADEDLKPFATEFNRMTWSFRGTGFHLEGQKTPLQSAFLSTRGKVAGRNIYQDQCFAALIRFAFGKDSEGVKPEQLVSGAQSATRLDTYVEQLIRIRDVGGHWPMREYDLLAVVQSVHLIAQVLALEPDGTRRDQMAYGLEALMDLSLRLDAQPLVPENNVFYRRDKRWGNSDLHKQIREVSLLVLDLPDSTGHPRADRAMTRLRHEMALCAAAATEPHEKMKFGRFVRVDAPRFVLAGLKALQGDDPLRDLTPDDRKVLIRMVPSGPVLLALLDQYPAARRSRVEHDFGL